MIFLLKNPGNSTESPDPWAGKKDYLKKAGDFTESPDTSSGKKDFSI